MCNVTLPWNIYFYYNRLRSGIHNSHIIQSFKQRINNVRKCVCVCIGHNAQYAFDHRQHHQYHHRSKIDNVCRMCVVRSFNFDSNKTKLTWINSSHCVVLTVEQHSRWICTIQMAIKLKPNKQKNKKKREKRTETKEEGKREQQIGNRLVCITINVTFCFKKCFHAARLSTSDYLFFLFRFYRSVPNHVVFAAFAIFCFTPQNIIELLSIVVLWQDNFSNLHTRKTT